MLARRTGDRGRLGPRVRTSGREWAGRGPARAGCRERDGGAVCWSSCTARLRHLSTALWHSHGRDPAIPLDGTCPVGSGTGPLARDGASWRGPGCPCAVAWREKSTHGRRTGHTATCGGRSHVGGVTAAGHAQEASSTGLKPKQARGPSTRGQDSRSFCGHVPVCLLHSD